MTCGYCGFKDTAVKAELCNHCREDQASRTPRYQWRRQPASKGLGPQTRKRYGKKVNIRLEGREWIDPSGKVISAAEVSLIADAVQRHKEKVYALTKNSGATKNTSETDNDSFAAMNALLYVVEMERERLQIK